MTQVLVAYASKMGATKEIAEAIGARLTEHGLRATVADAGAVDRVDDYDAIVLGSAIYATRWLPEARALPPQASHGAHRPEDLALRERLDRHPTGNHHRTGAPQWRSAALGRDLRPQST